MKPEIGISEKHLSGSINLLSALLADEVVLYTKTRKFHWNVCGDSFMELHKLFQSQYSELEANIDSVAERISKLGGKAIGTLKEFSQQTRLKENPGKNPSQKDMLKELLHDHESMVKILRHDIDVCGEKHNDAGTADFLTGMLAEHESVAWILRRYLS